MTKELLVKQAMSKVYEQIENMGYTLVYLAVQGSTNYDLDLYNDKYQSDVDMKAFVLPSFKDLYYDEKVSKTYKTKYGQVEVKDVRCLPELLGKMNPSYVELLFTPYFCTNQAFDDFVSKLRELKHRLMQDRFTLFVKALVGTVYIKGNDLFHNRESVKEQFDKLGYDPKQLHHALRLSSMLQDLFYNENKFDNVFRVKDEKLKQYLLDIKVYGVESIEVANEEMSNAITIVEELQDKLYENRILKPQFAVKPDSLNELKNLVYEMVKKEITQSNNKTVKK